MRKPILESWSVSMVLILLLSFGAGAQLTGSYAVIVEENGNALGLLAISGGGTVNLPLPLDAGSPVVKGGLYMQAANGIDVTSAEGEETTVGYMSALLTEKDGGSWTFKMEVPDIEGLSVLVSLPSEASVIGTEPPAQINVEDESRNLVWEIDGNEVESVSVTYGFPSVAGPDIEPDVKEDGTSTGGAVSDTAPYVIGAVAIAAAVLFFILLKKPAAGKGKKKVLKTLTPNELKLVTLLLDAGGGMKRNELEKESKMAKSSLASVLASVERRNIITVDRSGSVHYVELSEWFKSL